MAVGETEALRDWFACEPRRTANPPVRTRSEKETADDGVARASEPSA